MKFGNADDITKESDVPHYTYTTHKFLFHEQYILWSCYHISELYFDTGVCQLKKFGNWLTLTCMKTVHVFTFQALNQWRAFIYEVKSLQIYSPLEDAVHTQTLVGWDLEIGWWVPNIWPHWTAQQLCQHAGQLECQYASEGQRDVLLPDI